LVNCLLHTITKIYKNQVLFSIITLIGSAKDIIADAQTKNKADPSLKELKIRKNVPKNPNTYIKALK
jgi:hypothetical protein